MARASKRVRKRSFRWWLIPAALASLVLLGVLVVGVFALSAILRAHPTLSGTMNTPGLLAPADIVRDEWGVPHIRAENAHDLFFAQGYATAQDRLWQMEVNRRYGKGELSEIFGEETIKHDKSVRVLGFRRVAEMEWAILDADTKGIVQAYCDGVNAFIEQNQDHLPLEFSILGYKPELWKPVDTLVWGKVIAWSLSANWESKILRSKLADELGPSATAQLMPDYGDGMPVIVPPGGTYKAAARVSIASSDLSSLGSTPQSLGFGSNNWVVSGSKTATGKPLLANDPHLEAMMPSIWYQVHLTGGGYDVEGASFPGTPGVVIGHNNRIAWGMTNTMADVQDLFIERFDPADPSRYMFKGSWEQAEIVTETIKVKDRPSEVAQVRITRHGPIVNDIVDGLSEPTALSWTGLENRPILPAMVKLNKAQNWDEFREALRGFTVPSQNFVYADTMGNIGYQMPGVIPIRTKGTGATLVLGWSGEYEWKGYIPFDELPRSYNPASGIIVTANNRIVDSSYPYYISREWDPGFRASRISGLLSEKDQLTAEDFAQIQGDVMSEPAQKVAGLAMQAACGEKGLEIVEDVLGPWNGQVTAESPAPVLFNTLYVKFVRNTFGDELSLELLNEYISFPQFHAPAMMTLLDEPSSPWFDDTRTPEIEGRDDILRRSLAEAIDELKQTQGSNTDAWQWGKIHTLTFAHPLGKVSLLDRVLNVGPIPRDGDAGTINNGAYSYSAPYKEVAIPSLRFIADLSGWDKSLFVIPPGQSGHPFTAHFSDQVQIWLEGKHHLMPFSDEAVEKYARESLKLTP